MILFFKIKTQTIQMALIRLNIKKKQDRKMVRVSIGGSRQSRRGPYWASSRCIVDKK